ncbi:MAG: acyl-CoA synthetase (AMP-forming)/AMP-acid ligase II [Neolewinella sp.]|jgi:acyl-CoA synthetase (AMP-forming)/AMP-acid ligase II
MEYFEAESPLLPEILSLHGKWRAHQDAVYCDGQQLNWQQFVESNHRFANGLIAQNLKPNDAIGVVMSNGIPMLQAMMGAMAAGITSVPINLSVNDDALLNMLADAKVKALVVSADQLTRIDGLKQIFPDSLKLLISDRLSEKQLDLGWITIQDLTADQSGQLPQIKISDKDYLNIIYSSGTTGLPKGIVHTQAGRRDWAYDLAIALRYHCNSKTLLTLGLYSNISWVAMLTTLLAGGSLVIHKSFDAEQFLQTLPAQGITNTAMVPVQFQRVIEKIEEQPNRFNLSSMTSMMSCGSPLHSELKKSIFDHFACGIIELYGLTEGVITTIEPEQSEGRWSSVGKPLIGTDICIVDEDDRPQPAGLCGEIVSRGRITMPGYLNRPEANREAIYADQHGRKWLRTGDIGYFDDDGFLYVVDRKKDMILSGSQNIYPQDIEAILVENSAVTDVAVIAASSKRWGETPIALVVREEFNSSSESEIMQWGNERLGKQQRIAEVIFIDELPRNPNGKILKRELKITYAQRHYD